jgi:hypothetical protein
VFEYAFGDGGIVDECNDAHARIIQYFETKYENLVSESFRSLTRACKYLDVASYANMLELGEASENLGDAKGVRAMVKDNLVNGHSNRTKKRSRLSRALAVR